MSDPLSSIASVVSLLDIGARSANSLYHLVLRYYHAGDEFIALYNEVNADLTLFEQVRQDLSQHLSQPPRTQLIEAVSSQLALAKRIQDELVTLIGSWRESQPSAEHLSRIGWLNKRSTAKKLQEDLRCMRQHLHRILYE